MTDSAVILAAGLGTRLKWLTRECPKALMPLAGDPAIVHVIRRLTAVGIGQIAINLHHHADSIRHALGDGRRFGVRLVYSEEPMLLDSGGGVRQAMTLLPQREILLVHNADIVACADLMTLQQQCADADAALLLVNNPDHHPQGDFYLRGTSVVSDQGQCLTFGGVSCWRSSALLAQPPGVAFPLTRAIHAAIGQHRCRGLHHRGCWFDIGRPRDLFRASAVEQTKRIVSY